MEVTITSTVEDGVCFKYEGEELEKLALASVSIFEMLTDGGNDGERLKTIPVPVGGKILSLALEYCERHGVARSKHIRWGDAPPQKNFLFIEYQCDDAELAAWDQAFLLKLNDKQGMLLELLKPAEHLLVLGLCDLICQAVVDMIARKTINEIYAIFNIKSHYPLEDLKEAEMENISMYYGKPSNYIKEDFRPACIIAEYTSRRHDFFTFLSHWIHSTEFKRETRYKWLLEQPSEEDQDLKQFLTSIDEVKQQIFYRINKFSLNVADELGYPSCKSSHGRYQGGIVDIEIELRKKEVDMVHLANEEKDKVDEYINGLKKKWAEKCGRCNEKVLPHLLLLNEDCYSEIDEVLHYIRSFRVEKIQSIQEMRELLSSEQEKLQDDEKEDSMELESSEDPFDVSIDGNLASLLVEWRIEERFEGVIIDGPRFTKTLDKLTRQLLHQELAVKNYELLTAIAKAILDLYDRKSFRDVLQDKVNIFSKFLEYQDNGLKRLYQARENFVMEAVEITSKEKEKVDEIINAMLKQCDDKTPGRKEAIWYLRHCKKSHYAMIDEIRRQVEVSLALNETRYKKGLEGISDEVEIVTMEGTSHDYEADTSKGETVAKRRKTESSDALGTRLVEDDIC